RATRSPVLPAARSCPRYPADSSSPRCGPSTTPPSAAAWSRAVSSFAPGFPGSRAHSSPLRSIARSISRSFSVLISVRQPPCSPSDRGSSSSFAKQIVAQRSPPGQSGRLRRNARARVGDDAPERRDGELPAALDREPEMEILYEDPETVHEGIGREDRRQLGLVA